MTNNNISHNAFTERELENQGFSRYQSPSKDRNWYKTILISVLLTLVLAPKSDLVNADFSDQEATCQPNFSRLYQNNNKHFAEVFEPNSNVREEHLKSH